MAISAYRKVGLEVPVSALWLFARAGIGVCVAMLLMPNALRAESLTINSVPAGASVEINGSLVGQTPYKVDYPGGYFHKTHTAFSERLEHAIVLRISKNGFVARQITLSDGPFQWVGLTGHHHGTYFLLKADHFELKLDSTDYPGDAALGDEERPGPIRARTKAASAKSETNATGTVAIKSDPSGADIYVDGKFAGQTPSTFHLAIGTHQVEIRNAGRKSWTREIDISKDSEITLHPALAADP